MGFLIFSSNASNAAAFGKEKKIKENVYVCALPDDERRETREISNPKKNKNHSPNASSIARRAGHSSTLSLLREKTILSAQISKSWKERKFVSRLRSLHARAPAFTRNKTFRLKDYSFCSRTKIARTKKNARCSPIIRPRKKATHLNRSRSSASQTYLRAGDFKRELFFVFAFVFLCGKSGILWQKRVHSLLYLHLVAQNARSFHLNFRIFI